MASPWIRRIGRIVVATVVVVYKRRFTGTQARTGGPQCVIQAALFRRQGAN
jgi:hypothetical protein